MSPNRNVQLGQLIARARNRAGMSYRQLASEVDVNPAWLLKVERGDFVSPDPGRLARISDVLSIDPQRLNKLSGGQVAENLPEPRTYFRAKYGELSPDQLARMQRYVEREVRQGERDAEG